MPVVAPVSSITSLPAITCASRSALSTSVLPVWSRALSEDADPITPTLVFIVTLPTREPPAARQLVYAPNVLHDPTNAALRTTRAPAAEKRSRSRQSQSAARSETDRATRR